MGNWVTETSDKTDDSVLKGACCRAWGTLTWHIGLLMERNGGIFVPNSVWFVCYFFLFFDCFVFEKEVLPRAATQWLQFWQHQIICIQPNEAQKTESGNFYFVLYYFYFVFYFYFGDQKFRKFFRGRLLKSTLPCSISSPLFHLILRKHSFFFLFLRFTILY